MMLADLDYSFPTDLIALEPSRPTRVAWTEPGHEPIELDLDRLLSRFAPQDLFVINESKVIPARVFSGEGVEVLFLRPRSPLEWEVLFPAREFKIGQSLQFPEGVEGTLTVKNLPQVLTLSREISPSYFEAHGEMALPPYIQDARGERHNRPQDRSVYQTSWARDPGSVAAPTASLHFQQEHLERIKNVARLTLHVGAGTFFPIRTADIREHKMHSEIVEVPCELVERIEYTRQQGGRVWALGTTVARALESLPVLQRKGTRLVGETRLFVYPPFEFKNVDVLLTNFHQPKSSLLALVAAFAGLEQVQSTYKWAIERGFKLFSYGDLSAWSNRKT